MQMQMQQCEDIVVDSNGGWRFDKWSNWIFAPQGMSYMMGHGQSLFLLKDGHDRHGDV